MNEMETNKRTSVKSDKSDGFTGCESSIVRRYAVSGRIAVFGQQKKRTRANFEE